jgi:hypothetical protein
VDDLTDLHNLSGKFDFLLDYCVLDDLRLHQHDPHLQNMLALTHAHSRYLPWGFEYSIRWRERLLLLYDIPFASGEIEKRFGPHFQIEKIAGSLNWSRFRPATWHI